MIILMKENRLWTNFKFWEGLFAFYFVLMLLYSSLLCNPQAICKKVGKTRLSNPGRLTSLGEGKTENCCLKKSAAFFFYQLIQKCVLLYTSLHHFKPITCVIHLQNFALINGHYMNIITYNQIIACIHKSLDWITWSTLTTLSIATFRA